MDWLMSAWAAWSGPAMALGAGVVVGVGLVTAIGVFLLEAQRRRDQSAAEFQDRLAEPILRELGEANVSVLPTVRIPLWKAATRPAVIELAGQVPSREVRERVVRLVEREAGRLRYFRIENRIRIAPPSEESGRRLA
ncbi:MAG: hypothetical protein FJ027_12885 [Candidatus Rokubacteria bacterium]|nr:hypothetical protein [Candidatus Rokubacteria bacterium]